MIALRLFTASDPSRQLDMRVLDDRDELTIGRDAAAGWALPDPDRALSRLHLKVGVRGGAVSVTDTSTNGVTLATREARMPRDESVRVDLGERLEFGPYVVLIERADANARPEPAASPTAANPFLRGGEPEAAPRGAPPDPFASALPADPLSRRADPFTSGGGGGARTGYDAPAGGDAWAGKREQRAGDWDAPAERPAPEAMIGSTPVLERARADPRGGRRLRLRRALHPAGAPGAGRGLVRPGHPVGLGCAGQAGRARRQGPSGHSQTPPGRAPCRRTPRSRAARG